MMLSISCLTYPGVPFLAQATYTTWLTYRGSNLTLTREGYTIRSILLDNKKIKIKSTQKNSIVSMIYQLNWSKLEAVCMYKMTSDVSELNQTDVVPNRSF